MILEKVKRFMSTTLINSVLKRFTKTIAAKALPRINMMRTEIFQKKIIHVRQLLIRMMSSEMS